MTLSKLHYISQGNSPAAHLQNIQTACSSGVELVQLNLKDISEKEFLSCAHEARKITAHFQTRLLISDHYKIAKEFAKRNIHIICDKPLTSPTVYALEEPNPLPLGISAIEFMSKPIIL